MTDVSSSARSAGPVDYGVLIPAIVHFDDMDPLGMLHNTRYALLAERAWMAWAWQLGYGGEGGSQLPVHQGDSMHAVKAFSIEFEQPILSPGTRAVHLWTERIGRTSMINGFRVCDSDGGTTYARGTRTLVSLDPDTLSPRPVPDGVREAYAKFQRPQAS